MVDATKLETLDTALKNSDATTDGRLPPSPINETLPTRTTDAVGKQKATPVPLAKPTKTKKNEATGSLKSTRNQATNTPKVTKVLPHHEPLDKKEQVKRLEKEIQGILLWKRPSRSAAYFALIVSGLVLTKSYSAIQMVSAFLTIAIGVNLIYVIFTVQTQRILANRSGGNPYSPLLQNDKITTMDRNALQRNTELVADVVEAVLQKTSRIVFIEDTITSVKWLVVFYIVWKLSVIISVRTLATLLTFILFSVPLLYKYNKTLVDARIHQAQSVCQTHLEQGQDKLQQGWNQFCMRFQRQEKTGSASSMASGTQKSRKEN